MAQVCTEGKGIQNMGTEWPIASIEMPNKPLQQYHPHRKQRDMLPCNVAKQDLGSKINE
jgi:hypothetical protein